MGVSYFVFPVDDSTRESLGEMGVTELPEDNGRNPTSAEVRQVLSTLEGFEVDISEQGASWEAVIQNARDPAGVPWTQLRFTPGEAGALVFTKGWLDIAVDIVVRLAAHTGPLWVFAESGETPLIVRAGDDPEKLCSAWEPDLD